MANPYTIKIFVPEGDNDPVGDFLRTLTGDDTPSAQEPDDPYQNNYLGDGLRA